MKNSIPCWFLVFFKLKETQKQKSEIYWIKKTLEIPLSISETKLLPSPQISCDFFLKTYT